MRERAGDVEMSDTRRPRAPPVVTRARVKRGVKQKMPSPAADRLENSINTVALLIRGNVISIDRAVENSN